MNPVDFQKKWAMRYGMVGPITHLLKVRFKERWLRFHNLPDSKRYPETDAERTLILSRQFKILERLFQKGTTLSLCYNSGVYNEACGTGCMPESHFKFIKEVDLEEQTEPVWMHFNILPFSKDVASKLLLNVAEWDVVNLVIFDQNLDPLFCPYDGGMDIIMSDPVKKGGLRNEFKDWLSKHPEGF